MPIVQWKTEKIYGFYTSKNYEMRSINDGDILFFGNNRRDTSQSFYFFWECEDLNKFPLQIIKNSGPYKDQLC